MQIGEGGVRVGGRSVVAVLVTAAHCVLEDWEGAWMHILPVEPFECVEILAVPRVETVLEDPVSGYSVLLEHPLAMLIGYGDTALPPSHPIWSRSISPVFSCALVGTPHYDPPTYLYPACIKHSAVTQSSIARQLHEVYQDFGKKLVGKGVTIHRRGTLAAYVSASIGMSGAPIYEVKEGVSRLVGVLVCGPLSKEYAALLGLVRAVSGGDFSTATENLLELGQMCPDIAATLPPLISKRNRTAVLRRLNSFIPLLLSHSTNSGYNLGISINSPAFELIRSWSHRLTELRGDFKSISSLQKALSCFT